MIQKLMWVPGLFILYPVHVAILMYRREPARDGEMVLHAFWVATQCAIAFEIWKSFK